MGEWLLSRRDRLIAARHEVPMQFGHLERGTRGDLCPEGGCRTQPRVSTLGTLKINEFALTRHMNVRSMNNTRSSGLEMLKGREAD